MTRPLTPLSARLLDSHPDLDAHSLEVGVRATVDAIFDRLLERAEEYRAKARLPSWESAEHNTRYLEARRCASVPHELLEGS